MILGCSGLACVRGLERVALYGDGRPWLRPFSYARRPDRPPLVRHSARLLKDSRRRTEEGMRILAILLLAATVVAQRPSHKKIVVENGGND